jgi:protein SCO1/2
MKNFIKIMLLMVLGFGMGAIAATLKKPRVTEQPVAASPATAGDIAAATAASPAAPATSEVKVSVPATEPSLTGSGEIQLDATFDAPEANDAPAAVIVKPSEIKPEEPSAAQDINTDAFKSAAEAPAPVTPPPPLSQSSAPSVSTSFLLTDHNGVAVTEKSWPGKYLMVFFGFTHCPDICPTAMEKFSTALDKLGADASKVQVLFITVDPARDNAAAMKEYLSNYNPAITGLTGTEDQVKSAIAGFKVYAAKGEEATPGNYMMDHSGFTYVVAPDGQMKEVLKTSDSADQMLEKIKPLLQ